MSGITLGAEVKEQIESGYNLVMLMESLSLQGWQRVDLDKYHSNRQAVDIQIWVRENCAGKWHSFGRHWIFESGEDAVLFKLRWS